MACSVVRRLSSASQTQGKKESLHERLQKAFKEREGVQGLLAHAHTSFFVRECDGVVDVEDVQACAGGPLEQGLRTVPSHLPVSWPRSRCEAPHALHRSNPVQDVASCLRCFDLRAMPARKHGGQAHDSFHARGNGAHCERWATCGSSVLFSLIPRDELAGR